MHDTSEQFEQPEPAGAVRSLSPQVEGSLIAGVAFALLIPCFWQKHIEAGDLASHLYNAWLAGLIQRGEIPGLTLAHPFSNTLVDRVLAALLDPLGPVWTARLVCAAAVEIFFWGAFRFLAVANGRNPWLMAPCLAMLSYGEIFHFGFLNFYLSTGFCFWIVALLWKPTLRRFIIAIPLAALSIFALPLSLLWAVSVLAYFHIARRIPAEMRILPLLTGIAVLIVAQTVVMKMFPTQWSLNQLVEIRGIFGLTGALQFWLYGPKYAVLAGGVLILWFVLFLERLDRGSFLSDPLVHLWFLSMAAFALLPSAIKLPQYQLGLLFISERVSLFVAIMFCAVIGGGRHGRGMTRLSLLLAIAFFTFLLLDVQAINKVDAEITDLVSELPPGQRVTASLFDSGSGLNGLVHVLDWACIGRSFDYANYEPPSAAFRIRVLGPNGVVAATTAIAQEIEYGHHTVTPQEAPLYSLCPASDPGHRFMFQKLKAGDVTCGLSIPVTPQFFTPAPVIP